MEQTTYQLLKNLEEKLLFISGTTEDPSVKSVSEDGLKLIDEKLIKARIVSMNVELAISDIIDELARAESKFPAWPDDIIHAASIVAEESGELVRDALSHHYESPRMNSVLKEAIQTGAMALRFIVNLYQRSDHGLIVEAFKNRRRQS